MSEARDLPNAAIWKALRAWIDSREAQERETGASAITPGQAKQILGIIEATNEPEFDQQKNYVGTLNEYAQKERRGYPLPDFSKEEHIVTPGPGGGRWRVYCKLPWNDKVFPQPGHGFLDGEQAPQFSKKGVAKQFAAMQALDYVLHDLQDDEAPPEPATAFPSLTEALKTNQSSPAAAQDLSPSSAGAEPSAGASLGLNTGESPKQASDMQLSIRRLATEYRLKIPTYITKAEPERPGFFQGEAIFRAEPEAPVEGIAVRGIFGKDQATEQLAAKVLEWMNGIIEKRKASFAAMRDGLARSGMA